MSSTEGKVRANITIKGDVQGVGYRDVVKRAARKMKLTGFVENAPGDEVRIVCDGDRESVESFIKLIKIKEPPIDVEDLKVSFEGPTGKFGHFEIRRSDMTAELGERLDIANAKMERMIQKQDVMIQKQDETVSVLKEFWNETSENFKLLHSDNLKLHEITAKHDADMQHLFGVVDVEISELKKRLKRVESAVEVSQ